MSFLDQIGSTSSSPPLGHLNSLVDASITQRRVSSHKIQLYLAIIVRELVLISENGEVVVRVGAATSDTVLLSIYRSFASTSINERYLHCQIYSLYK